MHMLRGEWSWYLWGAGYQGSIDALITSLFPRFNAEETRIVGGLSGKQMLAATDVLRAILATIEKIDGLLHEIE